MTAGIVQDQPAPPAPAVADADTKPFAVLVLRERPRPGPRMIAGIVPDQPSRAAPAVADTDPQQSTVRVLPLRPRSPLAGLTAPPWPALAWPPAAADTDTQQFTALVGLPTVNELCAEHASVCASAVDPLEIASALEFDGISDNIAAARYGFPDVFALAEEMFRQVPRSPAEPGLPPDPWAQSSKLRPALHGLLYGLPAVCFPAAAGLLVGAGGVTALVVSLLISWSTSQALAYLGYLRLGRTDMGQAQQLLRAGLAAGLAILVLVMASTAVVAHANLAVIMFCLGQGAYMLGACVLLVLGSERLLFAALAPGVLGSAMFMLLGRPPQLDHVVWAALAATPLLALALAVVRSSRPRPPACRVFVPAELWSALPTAGFGLVAAGLLAYPVVAGPATDG